MKNSPYLDKPLRSLAEVEALHSSTEAPFAEEGLRGELTDLERALALRVRKPNRSIVREYDELQFSKDEALVIAAEFAVIRREAASQPTELERELTAALRDVLSAWEAKSGMGTIYEMQRAIPDARAVLAKATERGL